MKTMREKDRQIEARIERGDWAGARTLIRSELRRRPTNHWLLTRLSLTYYEQYQYRRALGLSAQALKITPRCPLALWDHAGSLDMLGDKRRAITIYQRLVRRGAETIATGECGEGLARARGLVADCLYRLGQCYENVG